MTTICILLILILVAIIGGMWFIYNRVYLNYVDLKIHMFHLIYTEAYGEPLICRKPSTKSRHDDADDTVVGYTIEEDGSWRQVFLKVPNHKLRKLSAPHSLSFDELIALILKNPNADPSMVDVYVASILRARKTFPMEAEQEL